MIGAPARLVLSGGFPDEPETTSWQEVSTLPGPRGFLDALFVEFCGTGLNDMPRTEDASAVQGDWQIRKITLGMNGKGICQVERKCLQTTALPLDETIDTFGLPGLDLHWEYHLDFAGQFGHTAFRHDRLTAQFHSTSARQKFDDTWHRVFGAPPVFQAV